MSLAYFPMYPDDFEADTAHLTLAEDGAYNRLLRLCWRTAGCSLPGDRAWIYRRMRATTGEDKAVVDIILDEFFCLRDGRLSNARLSKEWRSANEAHKRRVEAGGKGGKAKALKRHDSLSSNAEAKRKQPEPEPEPEPTHSSRAREASPDLEQGKGAVPRPGADRETASAVPHNEPGADPDQTVRERLLAAMCATGGVSGPSAMLGGVTDMAEARRWADMGLSLDDQCRLIEERMARGRARSPNFAVSRFSYFTLAMAELAEARRAPLTPKPKPAPANSSTSFDEAFLRRVASGS